MNEQWISDVINKAIEIGRQQISRGNVATYIPELGKARKEALGLCVSLPDGTAYKVGDTNIRFTIQSISKVISLCKALEVRGAETVFSHVGMEPSGEAFNSIVELDLQSNRPFNPMINSGAIAVESTIIDYVSFEEMLEYTQRLCSDPGITLNRQVYHSEMNSCDRNRAIAYLLKSKDIITTQNVFPERNRGIPGELRAASGKRRHLSRQRRTAVEGGNRADRSVHHADLRHVRRVRPFCGGGRRPHEIRRRRRADGPGLRPLRNRDLRSCVGSKGKLHRRLRDDEASLTGNGPAYVSG